jgi:hypothetical protein
MKQMIGVSGMASLSAVGGADWLTPHPDPHHFLQLRN